MNDEIINVNGSSLRGLSMEQVFAFVLFSPNHRIWCLQARNVLKNTSQNVDIIIARSPEGELNFLALVVPMKMRMNG